MIFSSNAKLILKTGGPRDDANRDWRVTWSVTMHQNWCNVHQAV